MQTAFDYRTNRDLFSNHYLDEQLPETEAWNAADAAVDEAYRRLDRLYAEQASFVAEYDERRLRENLLDPVFDLLGLTTAVEEPVDGERLVPDYALFGSERAREDAFEHRSNDDFGRRGDGIATSNADAASNAGNAREATGASNANTSGKASEDGAAHDFDGGDFYANALAVADAKRWGQSLDGHGERECSNPSYQIHVYLDATGLDRGILTNGKRWRLYYGPTSHRLDTYYEIDLPELLETGDPEEFKYFYLFFRREAFLGGSGTGDGTGSSASDGTGSSASDANPRAVPADYLGTDRAFVERVHRQSNVFAEELSEDLRENVYEALRLLAEGFVTAGDLGTEDIDRVYEASLIYLYRLIFVLYAESKGRDLLETDNDLYRKRYSLTTLKRRVAEELDSPDPIYREWQTTLWDRLKELFTLVDGGSAAQGIPEEDLYVPAYNGGLFKTDPTSGETATFLDDHAVGDRSLAQVIELLTRRDSEHDRTPDGGRVFVDYSSLDVRHLGSIYEGLLEYDLAIADEPLVATPEDGTQQWVPASEVPETAVSEAVERVEPGDVYLTTGTEKRKTTGSYYTPKFVVEYVVEHALDPLLDEIRADLDSADPDYAERFAERVFDLSVLDPAMGSGHFLVKTVEYLARAVVQAQQEQRTEAGTGTQTQTGTAMETETEAKTVTQAEQADSGDPVTDPPNVHWARRQVAKQCIYGVDENGMAVELAKVSLWLRTLAAEQPLAFLDHHLKQGDSLAGTDVEAVESLARDTSPNASLADFGATRADAIGDLMDAYREFVAIENETLSDVEEMERRYDEIRRNDLRRRLTAMANVHAAERFGSSVPSGAYERMGRSLDDDRAWDEVRETDWFREAQRLADERDRFHWKLSFPEVFYEPDGSPKGEGEAGFDAVVGNPPYVRSRNLPDDPKQCYRREFRTAEGAYDLYVPFVELATDLGRRISLVVPNKWTTTDYGRKLRDLLLDDHRLREVLDASNLDVFPDADIYPVVVTSERGGQFGDEASDSADDDSDATDDSHEIRVRQPASETDLSSARTTTVARSFVDRLGSRVLPLDLDPEFTEIAARVLADCDRLGDHATMSEGVHTGNVREKLLVEDAGVTADDAKGGTPEPTPDDATAEDATPTDSATTDAATPKEAMAHDWETLRKVVGGGSVGRYRLDWDGTWLRYDESLVERERGDYADLRDPDLFDGEKLLVRDISDRPVAVYDDADHYALNTLYSVRSRPKSGLSPRYLLGVFNSEFVERYYRQVYGGTHVSGDYLRFKPMFAAEIPVPDPDAATVEPNAVARRAGVEREVSEDPETAVATLTERRREASDERAALNCDVLDYVPGPSAGQSSDRSAGSANRSCPTLAEVGVPVEGVGDSVLAETAEDREGLRVGQVLVERDVGGCLVLSVTARYKPEGDEASDRVPDHEADRETDRWGYVETDPVPAIRFPHLGRSAGESALSAVPAETAAALVEVFVPAAAARGGGFAGFREIATKTNSLLDRLRALTLPNPERVADEVARFREVRARAAELDDRIEALEAAIDGIVYRLFGLDDEEIEVVSEIADENAR
jgi:hypothetical protein